MTDVTPRFKEPRKKKPGAVKRRAKQQASSIEVVIARSGGRCEAQTDWCEGAATQFHHIAGKDHNEPEDLLHVCGYGSLTGCHGRIHQHPGWARAVGLLRSRLAIENDEPRVRVGGES